MSYFLTNMVWWHWIVFALVLAALETLIPGAVAIWFAAAAAVIGLLLVVIPIPWQYQFIGFAVLGFAAMMWYLNYRKRYPDAVEQPNLNQRGQQYVGTELVLIEAIEQGSGKAKLGDGVWKVSGPELPAGSRVRVTGANGTILTVIPV
ncbi:MAG TPA: NfeD family protein [Steroidobacteraceae bacterium]|nr:NfeD family protein [Steroidobacteraceae bacterium]